MTTRRRSVQMLAVPLLMGALALIGLGCTPPPAPPGTDCPVGTFSATGDAPCTPAPPGTFVNTVGATSATQCALGTFQPSAAQVSCLLSPLGFFVAATGSTSATAAPAGTFVDTVGAASATPCAVGTFQGLVASISCTFAPVGSYVDVVGAVAAIECPPGTTTLATGSTSESDCVVLP
jgi:hypothetical protein